MSKETSLNGCAVAFTVLMLVFSWESPLEAYLDPGSGSMLVQLLLGGFAGLAVILKLTWHRVRDRFRPAGKREGTTSGDV